MQNLKVIRVSQNIRLMARAKNAEMRKLNSDTILTPNASSMYTIILIPFMTRKKRNGISLLIKIIWIKMFLSRNFCGFCVLIYLESKQGGHKAVDPAKLIGQG